jgi:hypothetical protein
MMTCCPFFFSRYAEGDSYGIYGFSQNSSSKPGLSERIQRSRMIRGLANTPCIFFKLSQIFFREPTCSDLQSSGVGIAIIGGSCAR